MPKYKLDAKPSTSSVRLVLRPAYYNTYATVFVRSVCLLPWISTTCAVRSPLLQLIFAGPHSFLCSGPRSEFRACEALKSPGQRQPELGTYMSGRTRTIGVTRLPLFESDGRDLVSPRTCYRTRFLTYPEGSIYKHCSYLS